MKTQKEIEDRIKLHQNNLDLIGKKLMDARSVLIDFWGENKKLIRVLDDMKLENERAIEFLYWTIL